MIKPLFTSLVAALGICALSAAASAQDTHVITGTTTFTPNQTRSFTITFINNGATPKNNVTFTPASSAPSFAVQAGPLPIVPATIPPGGMGTGQFTVTCLSGGGTASISATTIPLSTGAPVTVTCSGTAVPAMSTWGLAGLVVLLLGGAAWMLHRQRGLRGTPTPA